MNNQVYTCFNNSPVGALFLGFLVWNGNDVRDFENALQIFYPQDVRTSNENPPTQCGAV